MNVVSESLHVGELLVGMEDSARVALPLPRIVDVHVDIACILHARRDHLIRRSAHAFVVDLGSKIVPAVPAHGRRLRSLGWPWSLSRRRKRAETKPCDPKKDR